VIRHVVIWRFKDEAKRGGRLHNLDLIRESVNSMRRAVPGLLRLDLGVNQTALPDAADLMLYSEFESWEALRDYEEHPLHYELRALIGPLRLERRVVDYET
jgi:hypothetical protein